MPNYMPSSKKRNQIETQYLSFGTITPERSPLLVLQRRSLISERDSHSSTSSLSGDGEFKFSKKRNRRYKCKIALAMLTVMMIIIPSLVYYEKHLHNMSEYLQEATEKLVYCYKNAGVKDCEVLDMNLVKELIEEAVVEKKEVNEVKEVSERVETCKVKEAKEVSERVETCKGELEEKKKELSPDNIADYALESTGAEILRTIDTEPYIETGILNWLGIFMSIDIKNRPTSILQPWKNIGDCWAFKGNHGAVEIKLSHRIKITHVTIDHIPVTINPEGNIRSAPYVFQIIGIEESVIDIYHDLGTFEYSISGPPVQTFPVVQSSQPYHRIIFNVMRNHGNPFYTCVYKLRVHGELSPARLDEIEVFPQS